MSEISIFNQNAMATQFQVRIAGEEKKYAAQAAQAAFDVMVRLEAHLSRFRASSDISQIAQLVPGETLRLNRTTYACLEIAQKIEAATGGAFSVTAAARQSQPDAPRWTLLRDTFSIRCDSGKLTFDLGAIGKGFALDCMADLLREWSCPAFLLVAGGSSILAGDPPPETAGWSCGLGDNQATQRYWLKQCSLSGSGLAVKGRHILDPRTGQPAQRENRAWALADTAAESDALSTAAMVLNKKEITGALKHDPSWLVVLNENEIWQCLGTRPLPAKAN
jgi:thiamine biosynthesis lipoprotein